MRENTKKLLSSLMAVVMMVSMLPVSVSAQEQPVQTQSAESQTVPEMLAPQTEELQPVTSVAPQATLQSSEGPVALELGVPQNAVITQSGELLSFSFTPEANGLYWFSAVTGREIVGYIYDGDYLVKENYGESSFQMFVQLEAGKTYTLKTGYMGSGTGTYSVTVDYSPLESIVFSPISVTEGTKGHLSTVVNMQMSQAGYKYFYYDEWQLLDECTYTATFAGGAVITGSGRGITYNGMDFRFRFVSNQNYENQWKPGNTYTIDLEICGQQVAVPVTIVPSPLESITFTPITVIEGTNGTLYTNEWNPETGEYDLDYYYYYPSNVVSESTYTATFADDTVLTGNSSGFHYNGQWYAFTTLLEQSAANPMTAGNTYSMTVCIMGKIVEVPVTVISSPLESITFTPITVIEGTNGTLYTDQWNPETGNYDLDYYYYHGSNMLSKSTYTATFADDTVLTGNNSGFYYNDKWYSFSCTLDQSATNPMTAGNTYSMTVSVMGQTVQVPVTIRKTPVVSVSFAPVTMREGKGGYWSSYYPSGGEEQRYYDYHWWNNLQYTVTMDDNSTITGSGSSFYYDGQYFSVGYTDDQGFYNQWTVGNTYTVTASIMGVSAETTVTIDPDPLVSVTVDPIYLEENKGGYWNGSCYYYSNWKEQLSYTLTFRDGTTLKGSYYGSGVEYDGEYYYLSIGSYNQSAQNPWLTGNTYEVQVSVGNKQAAAYITICAGTEDNGYEYLIQDDKAVIFNCTMQTEILQIPETLGGYPVVGITGLGDAILYAKELRILDSVTMLSDTALLTSSYGIGPKLPLERIYIGSGISKLNGNIFKQATNLERIDVSPENPWLKSVDGVLYDAAVTTLIAFPTAKKDLHKIPDSVTDIDILFTRRETFAEQFANPNIQFGAGITKYKMVDGVIYNADMTKVLCTTAAATGHYEMPNSVTNIGSYAFVGSDITSVAISPNVVEITYTMFEGHIKLAEITIPTGLRYLDMGAVDNLKKIHITDLTHWCSGLRFGGIYGNPLSTAHDLYLNGEKIVDLVIPDVVTSVYANAFVGGSFESVTVPAGVREIGQDAFVSCENLKGVYISDLGAWSGTMFCTEWSNPLYYAHDLYLNGEKVKDLVLTETVADRIYGGYLSDIVYGGYLSGIVYGVNNYAFYNASIETVTVPKGIQRIGYEAFAGCDNLKQVHISDLAAWCKINFRDARANPLYYARDLYLNGEKLVNLSLPTAATIVYPYAFYNGSMTSVSVPEGVIAIGSSAFEQSAVEQVSFAEGISQIADAAFKNSAVKSLALPDSLIYVGSYAFINCKALESIDLGNGVTTIEREAFRNTGLKSVTLPKQLKNVYDYAFAESALTELIIDCDEVSFWGGAFAHCPLGDLEFGDNVKEFGVESFVDTNATQITIPASVTVLSYRAFAFNENLVSVTIPSSVKTIMSAFDGDTNLSHVLYTGTQAQWEELGVASSELNNATIHFEAIGNEVTTSQTCTTVTYYCSICDQQKTVRKGKITHNIVNGVCTICDCDNFWEYTVDEATGTVTITGYNGKDTDVIVPDRIENMPVTAITKSLFSYNRKLTSVVLPAGITQIPDEAFRNCSSLQTVTVGNQLTSVGDYAFYQCNNLRNIYLPDSVKTIGDYAFYHCWIDVKLPKSLTDIGEFAFVYNRFTNLKFPKALTNIGDYAFASSYIDDLVIPVSVVRIGVGAFSNAVCNTELTIPSTVTDICYNAFLGSQIGTLKISSGVKNIGENAFANCNGLETILFYGDRPNMSGGFGGSAAAAFYPAGNSTWDGVDEGTINWYPCAAPKILKQPVNAVAEEGETVVAAVEAYGHRMRYQWYIAEPGSDKFSPVGGDSIELSVELTKAVSGSRAYCVITDVLGQTTKTDTITIRTTAKPTGIRVSKLPYTVDYVLRQALRTRGLEIVLDYDDNSSVAVQDYQVSGYDPNVGGEQTITVTYGNYTATFTVTVNEEKLNFANQEQRIEISAPENAVDSDAELVVEKVETQPEIPEVPEILQENESVIFDISLEKDGEVVQPSEKVQVSIPVPEHMHSKRCKVYHIDENGQATDMNAHYKDGRLVFDTHHFSYYAVVETSGVSVSGIVSGSNGADGAVVKLLSGGEVLETVEVQNGTYLFENVVDNDYIIEVEKDGLPAKQYNITVEDRDVIRDVLLAILGDIDGNNDVDTDDVFELLLHISSAELFPINTIADFTGDGEVDADDVVQLLLHISAPGLFPLEVG